jgi:hypothetical protein
MNARIVMVIHDALRVRALQEEAAEVRHLMRLMIVKPLRAHYTRGGKGAAFFVHIQER